jgi:hypothetical protein
LVYKLCTYLAKYTEGEGVMGYHYYIDNPNLQPVIPLLDNKQITAKHISEASGFTTNWANENDSE